MQQQEIPCCFIFSFMTICSDVQKVIPYIKLEESTSGLILVIVVMQVIEELRMYCIDTEALVFMCNGGSPYSFTIHPILTRICMLYRHY